MKPKPQPRKIDTKKLGQTLQKIGGGMKDIALGAASHPVTASLFVMALTVALQFTTGAFDETQREKHPTLRNVHGQLNGLYDGAQKIAAASALAPIAVSAMGMVSSIAQMKSAKAAAEE